MKIEWSMVNMYNSCWVPRHSRKWSVLGYFRHVSCWPNWVALEVGEPHCDIKPPSWVLNSLLRIIKWKGVVDRQYNRYWVPLQRKKWSFSAILTFVGHIVPLLWSGCDFVILRHHFDSKNVTHDHFMRRKGLIADVADVKWVLHQNRFFGLFLMFFGQFGPHFWGWGVTFWS